MIILKDSIEFVQTDSVIIVTDSPKKCPWCSHEVLHRHAKYIRSLYVQGQRIQVVVPRFICTSCNRTTSLLPDIVGTHQQMSWAVQEQAYGACETGLSAEQTAMSVDPPSGPISVRTVQRWRKKWTVLLDEMEDLFWNTILSIRADVDLPVGSDKPQHLYEWMNRAWQSIQLETSTTSLFDFLHRLRRSSASMVNPCTSHTSCLS